METLYHPEVFIPESFTMPTERVRLSYSQHAQRASLNDRYGVIPAFETIPLSQFRLVELGMTNGKVSKIVVRGTFDAKRDVIFVLIPGPTYFVKTVWFNLRSDKHTTLNRSRYAAA